MGLYKFNTAQFAGVILTKRNFPTKVYIIIIMFSICILSKLKNMVKRVMVFKNKGSLIHKKYYFKENFNHNTFGLKLQK